MSDIRIIFGRFWKKLFSPFFLIICVKEFKILNCWFLIKNAWKRSITVVQVLCGTESVVFGKSDFSEWCPEARLELSLASPEHPLDQYTLVSARHQVGAFGSEAQAQNRQRVPVHAAAGPDTSPNLNLARPHRASHSRERSCMYYSANL